jgi:hypothetical protein
MLVTSEEALIPNSDLPEVSAFAAALSKRLKLSGGIVHARSVDVRRLRSCAHMRMRC